jgi:RNA polymerase sigma-70 factor (ECF subfamily)
MPAYATDPSSAARNGDARRELENPISGSFVWTVVNAELSRAAETAGDPASLEARRARFIELAMPRLDRAYRLAGLLLGSATEAEDAVQDALAATWRSWESLRDEARFDAWLDRTLVNGCRDRLRRRKVVRFIPIDGAVEPVDADPFAAVLARDAVLRHLAVLDVDERAVVLLHYWADLRLEDVATRLAIPVGTAKSRLHRALDRMRARLPEEATR